MPTRDRKVRMRVISRMDAASPDLERWFRGEVPTCWEMLLPNEVELLRRSLAHLEREHPGARPPSVTNGFVIRTTRDRRPPSRSAKRGDCSARDK